MDWTPGGMSSDIEDRRGDSGGGGGMLPFGGGGLGIVGVIVLVVLSLVTGRNFLGGLTGGSSAGSDDGQTSTQSYQGQGAAQSGGAVQESAAEHRDTQLVSYVLDDVQKMWTTVLPEQTGKNYRHAKLVLFRGQTTSGCGTAEEATGPFYCPQDERVYIDLDFWDELKKLGGNSADFAQGYVIAHELGHHVQNILGIEQKATQMMQDRSQRSRASVELELQADCFAGIWGKSQQDRHLLNAADVQSALANASAVGDDHIQKMQRGTVSPETFTHGSSAERQGWFNRGLTTGDVKSCNTFDVGPDGYQQ